jgi:Tol biopolymer transport system component
MSQQPREHVVEGVSGTGDDVEGHAPPVAMARPFTGLVLAALLVGACSGSSPATPAPTPSPSNAGPTMTPSSTATARPAATPSPTPIAVLTGEPWIVYEGPIEGGAGNRAVRPDGTGDHWLTPGVPLPAEGWQVHPDWSPDGTRLAFAADDAGDPAGSGTAGKGTRDLWVADADGTGAERLLDCTDQCTQTDHPAWSPDGRTLAFTTWDLVDGTNVHGRLALFDLATRTIRAILTVEDDRDAFAWPRWSPDGRRIVVEMQRWSDTSSNADLTATAIGVVNVDDATPTFKQLTKWTMWATYPDWHPTQDLIVFSTRPWDDLPDGPSNLYTIRPDGSRLTEVTQFAKGKSRAVQPTWTPDGTRIIFTAVEGTGFGNPTMATILPDGTGMTSATTSGPMFGTHPRLRPTP